MANRTRLLLTATDRADVIKDFLETELRVPVRYEYFSHERYEFRINGDPHHWLNVSKEYLADDNPTLVEVIEAARETLKHYRAADKTKRLYRGTKGLRDES